MLRILENVGNRLRCLPWSSYFWKMWPPSIGHRYSTENVPLSLYFLYWL